MRLGEVLIGAYQATFRRKEVIKAPRRVEAPKRYQPRFRSEAVYTRSEEDPFWGLSTIDLGFAVKHKRVKPGDVLSLKTEHFDFDTKKMEPNKVQELVYVRPDRPQTLGDSQLFYFCSPESIEDYIRDEIAINHAITRWDKVGRVGDAELQIIGMRLQDKATLGKNL